MPKVKLRVATKGHKAGDVLDVDAATAKRLVDGRHAVKVRATKSEDDKSED